MSQCPKCGATIETGAAVCGYCGTALDDSAASSQPGDQGGRHDQRRGEGDQTQQRGDSQAPYQQGDQQLGQARQPQQGRRQQPSSQGQGQPRSSQSPQGESNGRSPGDQPGQSTTSARDSSPSAGYQKRETPRLTQAKAALTSLPWVAGTTAGGLIYLFGIGWLWMALAEEGVPSAAQAATYLFASLLTFSPPTELAQTLTGAGYLAPGSVDSGALGSQYGALLAVGYLFVPWLLYKSGHRFAWHHGLDSGNVLDYVMAGATVIAGTSLVIGIASLAFGGDVVSYVFIVGLLVPGALGTVGGLGAWAFRKYRRTPSWGSGFIAGFLGLLLTTGLAVIWGSGSLPPGDAIASWLMASLATFVGVATGEFSAGDIGLLGYAAVTLPVLAFGYFRARRGEVTLSNPIEGARAGATIIAGFSTLFFLVLTTYTFLFLGPVVLLLLPNPLPFLPSGVTGQSIPQMVTFWNYLQAFVVGGILFPFILGAVGGAFGGYLEGRSVRSEEPSGESSQPR